MSVLQRKELEDSPLADLHAIASELGLESFRSLRRDDLIKAILDAQGGDSDEPDAEAEPEAVAAVEDPRADEDPGAEDEPAVADEREPEEDAGPSGEEEGDDERERAGGTLDILQNGSGFVRVGAGGQSRDDVYVSPAQIRRCELRAGDELTGPVRPPRRNERHPSLVRVETVNDNPAEPPEERPLFSDLTPTHATDMLPAPALLADLPYGKGSRVAITGAPGAGLTRLLGEILDAVAKDAGDVSVSLVLVGARPEEVTGWHGREGIAVSGGSFEHSIESQGQAAELAVERAKRVAERGGDALVALDSLEALPGGVARRVFGAARKLEQGGSLTVVAVVGGATEPLRQASTQITLDASAKEPTVLEARSRVQRVDLLT